MNGSAATFVAIAGSLALTMFVIGLRATRDELSYLPRHPALWLRSAFVMSVLVPLLALWLPSALHLRPAVPVGLFILALSPVPLVLPVRRLWGEAGDAYAVSLVTLAGVLGVVVAPLAVPLVLGRLTVHAPVGPSAIGRIVWMGVLLPWLAGATLRRLAPTFVPFTAELLSLASSILLIAGMAALMARLRPTLSGLVADGTISAIVVLAVGAVLIGRLLGGPVRDDRRLLACAATSRHPGVAIVIAWTLVPNDKLVMAAIVLGTVVGALASFIQALVRPRQALLDHRTMPAPPFNVVG